jgi:hypothetical protein
MAGPARPKICSQRQDIRLIYISPGEQHEHINCTFEVANLQNPPPYEALSYVWGDPNITVSITISSCAYQVTVNLGDALRHVRKRAEPRLLWVDAICINQGDNEEKSLQVGMMRNIYAKAFRCVIWLGDSQHLGFSDAETRSSLDVIKMLAEDVHTPLAAPLDRAMKALEHLMGSPWWSRIWTVQEIVVSSSAVVHWGSQSMEWSIFEKAAEVLVEGNLYDRANLPFTMDQLPAIFHGHRFSGPIIGIKIVRDYPDSSRLDTLRRFRYRQATDPRDKVFGLAGLQPSSTVVTDYSLDVVQVYKQTTKDLIQSTNSLAVLIGRRGEERQIEGLPSWTADWTRPKDPLKHWDRYWDHSFRYGFYDADKSTDVVMEVDEQASTISLSGLPIDLVEFVGEASMQDKEALADGDLPVSALQSTILRWQGLAESHFGSTDGAYIGGGTWQDAFWRTMAGNLVTSGGYPERRAEDADRGFFDDFCHSANPEDLEYGFELYDGLRSNIVNQAFFITKSGYMGIGPPMILKGDAVWVLFGSRVPFLLRPLLDSKGEDFALLGDGYLHGTMNGEAVAGQKFGGMCVVLH